jgi:hypothetical protein
MLPLPHVLLGMVVGTFALTEAVVIGLDDTLERRRGAKIKAKGIYREPVRSSHSHMVKASGLRWLCAMVLAEIPSPSVLQAVVSNWQVRRMRGYR